MANFKRGKCRTQGSPHYSKREWDKTLFGNWTCRWPRRHDILFHNRPRRRKDQRVADAVLKGRIDADEAIWPIEKKPHIYYW